MSKIIDKVDHSLKTAETICPYCDSKDTKINSHSTTLVGGDPDPNHHTVYATCNTCNKGFWKEYQHANVWYSEDFNPQEKISKYDGKPYIVTERKLLKGLPSCFESWVYNCECGGHIRRRYAAMDGSSEVYGLSYSYENGKSKPKNFRVFFDCDKCGSEETTCDNPYNEVWQKTIVNVDEIIREGKEREVQPWLSDNPKYHNEKKFRTKNVIRLHMQVIEQSKWYYDKNNEWKKRKPIRKTYSLKKMKMYLCKQFANSEEKWEYGLPWRVFEEVGIAVANSRGVSKLTMD